MPLPVSACIHGQMYAFSVVYASKPPKTCMGKADERLHKDTWTGCFLVLGVTEVLELQELQTIVLLASIKFQKLI